MSKFRFRGDRNGHLRCPSYEAGVAHPPHVAHVYRTVRWGALECFCRGLAGLTAHGDLRISIDRSEAGDPAYPSLIEGSYWYD